MDTQAQMVKEILLKKDIIERWEWEARLGAYSPERWTRLVLEHTDQLYIYVDPVDGQPLLMGGINPHKINGAMVGQAWMTLTTDALKQIITITRMVKRIIKTLHSETLTLIYVISWHGNRPAHRWLKSLGFQYCKRLDQYGVHGETFKVYGLGDVHLLTHIF
ncbi:hypothetical protein ACQZV8_10735 [Magnetococcales bacterium HHB-1]